MIKGLLIYETRICECPCKQEFICLKDSKKRYFSCGHTNRGRHRKFTEEHKKRIGFSKLGKSNWRRGLAKETDERIRRQSETQKLYVKTPEHRKNHSASLKLAYKEGRINCSGEHNGMYGKRQSAESNARRSITLKKQHDERSQRTKLWWYEIGNKMTHEEKQLKYGTPGDKNYFHKRKGKTNIEWYGEEKAKIISDKLSSAQIRRFLDIPYKNQFISNILSKTCQRPNKFERNCEILLGKQFPDKFKYCGNGSVIINGKSPDFISEELQTVVLCHGVYWHLFKDGLTLEDKPSVELVDSKPFINAGYKVWFIWEDEICVESYA